MPKRLTADAYIDGILNGDRVMLSRAITVIESRLRGDKKLASAILQGILPKTGNALRIGITGVPGVGKSTFIEAFGQYLTSLGKHIAVLAIDPSSRISGGSILGDKTRMENLAHDSRAYIRPSSTGLSLGGVARNTRNVMLLCEAAGYEVILVETVGVGQSETLVKGMTDFFLLLMLAGAGDELQGIKKGIMEMVDAIAINKADGVNELLANQAVSDYQSALHLMSHSTSGFTARVLSCSALERRGMDTIWETIEEYVKLTNSNGFFVKNRQSQNMDQLHSSIQQALQDRFYENNAVKSRLLSLEKMVSEGNELPVNAAEHLIDLYLNSQTSLDKS
ncbi:methylmalonyl Co-A mutase-associated GTPase MeaB [Dyadobacter sp. CY323]|uniref:methylmalonyl Co-A mutase-associated GTPase MeaB n=1 Tax=Dyadobacter sp. CY323 TaxID=2907302 RepID=UPI001F485FB2|nr:methylmalonyl Co-A mutase-associated GTPase MeaB [Dyadobacter sp. CY323]MCE6989095.1 methylmalonyl Co-A mutase-associated GTPase MeaB [Dyadobacter sp. CY323]